MDIDDLERLLGHIKRLISMRKRQSVLSGKDHTQMTQKAWQKNNANLTWLAMDIDKAEHEAHAAAVDVGISPPRSSYGIIEYRPSAFHYYRHKPTLPRGFEGETE